MAVAVADVSTPHAAKYLVQLCKHWAHKLPVEQDGDTGRIALGLGRADLLARGGVLRITLTAPDPAQLAQLKDVVARHLVRFAFREELAFDWRVAGEAADRDGEAAARRGHGGLPLQRPLSGRQSSI